MLAVMVASTVEVWSMVAVVVGGWAANCVHVPLVGVPDLVRVHQVALHMVDPRRLAVPGPCFKD